MSIGLGLSEIRGVSEELDLYGRERCIAAVQEHGPVMCNHCGSVTHQHDHRPLKRIVDVPQGLQRTYITLSRWRWKCAAEPCGKVMGLPRPSSLDPEFKCTQRLTVLVEAQCLDLQRIFEMIAGDVGISDRTLRSMFDRLFDRMEQRVLRVASPGTLRVYPDIVDGKKCLLIENVTHDALVDILDGGALSKLSSWLQDVAQFEPPSRVLIPPDRKLYLAVKAALPACRIVLAPDQVRQALTSWDQLADHEAQAVLDVYSPHFLGSKREWLQQLRKEVSAVPELRGFTDWLKEWEELLILGGPQDLKEPRKLDRAVQLLNILGNKYSFGRLRQRLLLQSQMIKVYHHRSSVHDSPRRITFAIPEVRYVYGLQGRGRPLARVGIPLGWLIEKLSEAVDPTTFPEGPFC